MIAIQKYPLRVVEFQAIPMPVDSHIISVQLFDGVPTIFAEVSIDQDNPISTNHFLITQTGYQFSTSTKDRRKHLASLTMPNGIVIHIYQIFRAN